MSPADAPYALVGTDIQLAPLDRADRLRDDPAALAAMWPAACVLRLDGDGRAATDAGGAPSLAWGETLGDMPADADFLGIDAESVAWFACTLTDPTTPRTDLRRAAAIWPVRAASAYATAHALHHWHARHRYCGGCGGEVEFVRGGWLGRCLRCAREHYPRTDPAVIVAVGEGTRLLMGRQSSWPARRYSVIAGFVEPGETLEQAVAREVMEETGIRITGCRYLGSQPWPFPTSLMLGFIADAGSAEIRGSDELEEARWFERAEIVAALEAEARGDAEAGPFLPPARISIAHWLVRQWVAATA
ncbi:MAG TPA: NAD(+) diphosphatase [Lysobacter sp.]